MSEVVRACFQGVQAPKVIEDRLREADKQCYLTWQTEIKEKRFILSYVTENGAVKHATVPNPSARKVYGSLSDASDILERMILSNDDCLHPVKAPAPPCRNDVSDDNNNISLEEDYVVSDLSCYACGHVAEHRRELFQHVRTHSVKECVDCSRFIAVNSIRSHVIKCKNDITNLLSCRVL